MKSYQESTPHSSVHSSFLTVSLSHQSLGSRAITLRQLVVVVVVQQVAIVSEQKLNLGGI
jgi:hypothetical protein